MMIHLFLDIWSDTVFKKNIINGYLFIRYTLKYGFTSSNFLIDGSSGSSIHIKSTSYPFSDNVVHSLNTLASFVKWFQTNIQTDRKSTRLNSSHVAISYAVFCLKKKTHKT